MFTYIFIFISKIIENSLATLRLIVVSNGKKWLGAILQLCIAIVWILATGMVVVNIHKDPLKILFFALGSFIGSYVGSIIEEKMAMGSNMVIVITKKEFEKVITEEIRSKDFAVTSMQGNGFEGEKAILLIMVARKKRRELTKCIKKVDSQALIISETARTINGGYPLERSI